MDQSLQQHLTAQRCMALQFRTTLLVLLALWVLDLYAPFAAATVEDDSTAGVIFGAACHSEDLLQDSLINFQSGCQYDQNSGVPSTLIRASTIELLHSCSQHPNNGDNDMSIHLLVPDTVDGMVGKMQLQLQRAFAVPGVSPLHCTPVLLRDQYNNTAVDGQQQSRVDARMTDGSLIGTLAAQGLLANLTPLTISDPSLDWAGVLPLAQQQATYDGAVVMLPLDGPMLLMYYRSDILAADGAAVPQTWDQLLRTAQALNGTDLDANGRKEHALCLDTAPGCRGVYILQAIWASMTQALGTSNGSLWWDTEAQLPLVNSASMPAAMAVYQALSAYAIPEDYAAAMDGGGCDLVSQAFAQGQCIITFGWFDQMRANSLINSPQSSVAGRVRAAPLPGSTRILNRAKNSMMDCTPALCPFATHLAQQDGSIVLANMAPTNALSGIGIAINGKRPVLMQFSSYLLMSYFAQPKVSWQFLLASSARGGPFRVEHVTDIDRWVAAGYDRGDVTSVMDAYMHAASHPNLALSLQAAGATEVRMAMSDAMMQVRLGMSVGVAILQLHAAIAQVYPGDPQSRTQQLTDYYKTLPQHGLVDLASFVRRRPRTAFTDPAHGNRAMYIGVPLAASVVMASMFAFTLFKRRHLLRKRRAGSVNTAVVAPGVGLQTTLLITDIQDSTNLWESLPATVMDIALHLHHECIRRLVAEHNGFESATEGDSFILAFHTALEAVQFSLHAQQELTVQPWPPELMQHDASSCVYASKAQRQTSDARAVLVMEEQGFTIKAKAACRLDYMPPTLTPSFSVASDALLSSATSSFTQSRLRPVRQHVTLTDSPHHFKEASRRLLRKLPVVSAFTSTISHLSPSVAPAVDMWPQAAHGLAEGLATAEPSSGASCKDAGDGGAENAATLRVDAECGQPLCDPLQHVAEAKQLTNPHNVQIPQQSEMEDLDSAAVALAGDNLPALPLSSLSESHLSKRRSSAPAELRPLETDVADVAGLFTCPPRLLELAVSAGQGVGMQTVASQVHGSARGLVDTTSTSACQENLADICLEGDGLLHPAAEVPCTAPSPHANSTVSEAFQLLCRKPSNCEPLRSRRGLFGQQDLSRLCNSMDMDHAAPPSARPALSRLTGDITVQQVAPVFGSARRRRTEAVASLLLSGTAGVGGSSQRHLPVSSSAQPVFASILDALRSIYNPCAKASMGMEQGTEISMRHGARGVETSAVISGHSGSTMVQDDSGAAVDTDASSAVAANAASTNIAARSHLAGKDVHVVFCGLRVRMGMHSGLHRQSELALNRASGRITYSGDTLAAARLIADAGHGGQVLLSAACYAQVTQGVKTSGKLAPLILYIGEYIVGKLDKLDPTKDLRRVDIYQATTQAQLPRIAFLPPLRCLSQTRAGVLATPLGHVAIAYLQITNLSTLPARSMRVAEAAMADASSTCGQAARQLGGCILPLPTAGHLACLFLQPETAQQWGASIQQALLALHKEPNAAFEYDYQLAPMSWLLEPPQSDRTSVRSSRVSRRGPRARHELRFKIAIHVGNVKLSVRSAQLLPSGQGFRKAAALCSSIKEGQVVCSLEAQEASSRTIHNRPMSRMGREEIAVRSATLALQTAEPTCQDRPLPAVNSCGVMSLVPGGGTSATEQSAVSATAGADFCDRLTCRSLDDSNHSASKLPIRRPSRLQNSTEQEAS